MSLATGTRIAVVLPLYRAQLSRYEKCSVRQIVATLSDHEIVVIAPRRLGGDAAFRRLLDQVGGTGSGFRIMHFDDHYFESLRGYNKLMLSLDFYREFEDYSHMLVAQTDVFIFGGGLDRFLEMDYDYVGAPWFEGDDAASVPVRMFPVAGNGGLSLRKIASFIRVLSGEDSPLEGLGEIAARIRTYRLAELPRRLAGEVRNALCFNRISRAGGNIRHFEDGVWSRFAPRIDPAFRVAPPEEAMKFSFERFPRHLFALNGQILPFGCHAWWKHDLEFWRPHIEARGHRL